MFLSCQSLSTSWHRYYVNSHTTNNGVTENDITLECDLLNFKPGLRIVWSSLFIFSVWSDGSSSNGGDDSFVVVMVEVIKLRAITVVVMVVVVIVMLGVAALVVIKIASLFSYIHYIDGSVQDCSISSALAMEILLSCTKPSIYGFLGRLYATKWKWRA